MLADLFSFMIPDEKKRDSADTMITIERGSTSRETLMPMITSDDVETL